MQRTVGRRVRSVSAGVRAALLGWGTVRRILVAGSVASTLAGCGGEASPASRPDRLNFGTFAGYVRVAPIRSVGATLTVPRITGQAAGAGATWIAAEADTPSARRAPFIQVGVSEIRRSGTPDAYDAFWTDTARGFVPVDLFVVHPDDRLTAGLTLTHHRWIVAIADLRTGRHVRFATREDADASFHTAEWLQEDPFNPTTRRSEPYPQFSGFHISNLTANGSPPPPASTNIQWMSRGRQVLEPTALRHDAFTLTLTTATLTPPARRYLTSEQAFTDASIQPLTQLADATATTPHARTVKWVRQVAAALTHALDALHASPWPPDVTPDITAQEHALRRVLERTEALASQPVNGFNTAKAQWEAASTAATLSSAQLHRALHAPPVQAPLALRSRLLPHGPRPTH
jgi:hypothetical protein